MIRDTRTNKRQKRYVENINDYNGQRRFDQNDWYEIIEDALRSCSFEHSDKEEVNGTSLSACVPISDYYGRRELPCEFSIWFERFTKDALFFMVSSPKSLRLSDLTDVNKFEPSDDSLEAIEEALDSLHVYKNNSCDKDFVEAINEQTEEISITFESLFKGIDRIETELNGNIVLFGDKDMLEEAFYVAADGIAEVLRPYCKEFRLQVQGLYADVYGELSDRENALYDEYDESKVVKGRNDMHTRMFENRYSKRRNRRFENHNHLDREDFFDMVEEAFSACSFELSSYPYIKGNALSAYVETYDSRARYGDIPYQGYIRLEDVTKNALVFNTVFPDSLRLSNVVDVDRFKPEDDSRESIEEALDEAKSYRDDGYLNEDIAYAMNEHGHVNELIIKFRDMFDDIDLFKDISDDSDIELDENGKPIMTEEDDIETVTATAVDYLKREFESYQQSVSGDAVAIYDDLVSEMDSIIEDLEDALSKAKKTGESHVRNRRFVRRR